MRSIFFISAFLLLMGFRPVAQSPYSFYPISLDKGLSDSRVNAIVQDKYGYMWFGTANGLNRFDGYSFTTYYSDAKRGLPSNNILSLYTDSKGGLWVGTAAGAVRFDFVRDRFIHFDTTDAAGALADRTGIYDFREDRSGNIYAGGVDALLCYYPATNRWENLSKTYDQEKRMRTIRKIRFLNDDILYAACGSNLPFFTIDIRNKKIDSLYYKINLGDTCCAIMFGLEKLNDHEMIVGLLSAGISIYDAKTKKFRAVDGGLKLSDSIRFNTAYDILRDHSGRVWIASYYFRLSEYIPSENRVVTVEHDPYNPFGYDGGSAISLYEDRQHNIWIGTGSKGVYRFNPEQNAVRFHAGNDFLPGALQSGGVLSMAVVDSNILMLGTEKGPSFLDRRTGIYKNYRGTSLARDDQPAEMIQVGIPDKKGFLWMGSNRLGLMEFDLKRKSFRNFSRTTKPNPVFEDGTADILVLPDGRIFQLGFGRPGIFDPVSTEYFSYRKDTSAVFKLNGLGNAAYDSRQHIWMIQTNGRLYEWDPFKNQLHDRSSMLESLGGSLTLFRLVWHREELFIGSNKGLLQVKKDGTRRIHSLDPSQSAVNDFRGLLPVDDHLWFCNSHTIGRIDLSTGNMMMLGEKEGLAHVQLMPRSLTLASNGNILIGTTRGYFEIDPDLLRANESPNGPFLTAFRIYDKPFEGNDVINNVQSIRLRYFQNFFAFDMSAFNYSGAEDIEYAYKLENFDKDWQYLGNRRTGSYTNVPGGNYVLRLRSRYGSGEWQDGQSVEINVGKAFTATWLFRVLIVSLVAGLTYLFYRIRIQRINKEARLRSDYEIKLNELENSALRTQMNPHFIFNSLNTINSFINSNDRIQANQYISKFSKLVRLILDHSREKRIVLSDELEVAELYLQLEQIRFERKFGYDIQIEDVDPTTVEVPPLIIQPFVENAILHGLLPKESGGELAIRISKHGELLQCIIEDNGIGRDAAKKIKESSGYRRKSHGMEITLKRIELFNREHGVMKTVEIEDLKGPNGNAGGTRVVIALAYLNTF